jgi:hypothetical protein
MDAMLWRQFSLMLQEDEPPALSPASVQRVACAGSLLVCCVIRDDVDHNNNSIDWGQWAITSDDPDFGGTGNPDTGADYGAAPGEPRTLIAWRRLLGPAD